MKLINKENKIKKIIKLFLVLGVLNIVLSGWMELEASNTKDPNGNIVPIDLTKGSGHIINRKVFEMLTEPHKFMGNRVKAAGPYQKGDILNDEDKNSDFIIVEDAIGCCAQGLKLFLDKVDENYKFPETGKEIELYGVLKEKKGKNGLPFLYLEVYNIKNL